MNKITEDDKKYLKKMCRYVQSEGHKKAHISEWFDYDEEPTKENLLRRTSEFTNGMPTPMGFKELLDRIIDDNVITNEYNSFVINNDINSCTLTLTLDCIKENISVELDFYVRGTSSVSEEFDDESIIDDLILSDKNFSEPNDDNILELSYEGAGDSGYLSNTFNDGQNVPPPFEDWCYTTLSNNFGGWEINEGSSGYFEINFEEKKVTLYHTEYSENEETVLIFIEYFG